MSDIQVRNVGEPHIYKVDKERGQSKIDEIEVQLYYRRGHGYRVTLTPQKIVDHGGYRMKEFDFWQVKKHDVMACKRFSPKSREEAMKTLKEFEPYWVAQMAASLDLVLEHDPIHRNW